MGTQDIYLLKNFAPQSIDGLDVTWKHIEHGRRRSAKPARKIEYAFITALRSSFPSLTGVLRTS